MIKLILLIFLSLAITLNGQVLYFPDDVALKQYISTDPIEQIPTNLTELRGTDKYKILVDQILTTGLIKLTLGINNAILENNNGNDNIVYAPLNIGGK